MDNVVYSATVDLDLGNRTTYKIGSTFPNELITQTSHTFQLTLNDSGAAYDISGITASTVKIKKNDSTASATTLATGTLTTDGTDGRIDFVINKDLIPASLAAFNQSPNRPQILYYITIEDADSKIQVRKLITVYDIDGTGTSSANPEAADFDYTPTTAGDWTPWASGGAPALVGTALDDTAEWINDTGLGKLDKSGGTMTGILREAKGADVASATALTLGTDGNFFDITGTTTITSIATLGVGSQVTLQFDGALTLTHHATDLILQGSNITTVAGDTATFIEYATGDWKLINYISGTETNDARYVNVTGDTMTGALVADVAGTVATFNRTGSDGVVELWQKDGTGVGGVVSAGTGISLVLNSGVSGSGLRGQSGVIAPIDNTGGLVDNTIDLGNATYRFKDFYLSGGAYLGGTASNNLLSAMDRQSFTPTFNNFTIGNGSVWGYYQTINDICHVSCGWIFGSTSAITGNVTLAALPEVSANNGTYVYYEMNIALVEAGVAVKYGKTAVLDNASTSSIIEDNAGANVSATVPFTWGANDCGIINGSYPIN